jgi:hypothetical protein
MHTVRRLRGCGSVPEPDVADERLAVLNAIQLIQMNASFAGSLGPPTGVSSPGTLDADGPRDPSSTV